MKCDNCHGSVRPIVALDIDGTLGQYHQHFINFLRNYLGIAEESWDRYDGSTELSDWLGLDKRTYQDAKLAFRSGGYKRWMPAFPGVERLVSTAKLLGVDLWITTTRPWLRLDNIDPDTREWLARNGVEYEALLFDEDKYLRLVEAVDPARVLLVLEDQADQYDRAEELGLPVVLRATKWNRGIIAGRHIVEDLHEAAEVIKFRNKAWRDRRND